MFQGDHRNGGRLCSWYSIKYVLSIYLTNVQAHQLVRRAGLWLQVQRSPNWPGSLCAAEYSLAVPTFVAANYQSFILYLIWCYCLKNYSDYSQYVQMTSTKIICYFQGKLGLISTLCHLNLTNLMDITLRRAKCVTYSICYYFLY